MTLIRNLFCLCTIVIFFTTCDKEDNISIDTPNSYPIIKYSNIQNIDYNGEQFFSSEDDIMWSWWNYPLMSRSIINKQNLIWSFTDKLGNTGILSHNINETTYKKITFQKDYKEVDDHNAGAVISLNDGSLITAFSESHNRSRKFLIYKSNNKIEEESWRKVYDKNMAGLSTYSQILYINDVLYIFCRIKTPNNSWNWSMIKSKDYGETWSAPSIIISSENIQWYALFRPVLNDNNLIKIVHYSNPNLSGSSIRGGYIDLKNNKVLNANGKNVIGNIGHPNNVENFEIIVPSEKGFSNRLFDLKINEFGNWEILYCKYTTQYDGFYYLHDNGSNKIISDAGSAFLPASRYYGGATFGENNTIYLSRNSGINSIYSLEEWKNISGDLQINRLLYSSNNKIIRPIFHKGIISVLEGEYDSKNYKNFNTRLLFKVMSNYDENNSYK